jgi:xanthine dehydrogenase YagR molybdenum-binding subunit
MSTAVAYVPDFKPIGEPIDRVDGRAKVTGAAKYAAEFPAEQLTYGYVVQSTIARGRITDIDTSAAEHCPGVLAVITYRNAPRLVQAGQQGAGDRGKGTAGKTDGGGQKADGAQTQSTDGAGQKTGRDGEGAGRSDPFAKPYVLQDDQVRNFGQHVAVVVAETFEQARDAARRVRVKYAPEVAELGLEKHRANGIVPEKLLNPEAKPETKRGDIDQGLSSGDVRIDVSYLMPNLHNNPMEPHATIAVWSDSGVTLYDATQNVNGTQRNIATLFGLEPKNVRVIAYFIGGGFGCKGPTWEHTVAATLAAKAVRRPVKLVLERRQMFSSIGYRPQTEQRMRLGAKRDGTLTALAQEIYTVTNRQKEYIEPVGAATPMLYSTPNLLVSHKAVALDLPRGTIMRAPGECTGMYALECAMDELAYALRLDPIELRRRNEPAQDPQKHVPWSSRSLVKCFEVGAAKFGWNRRSMEPRSMRDGRYQIGWGVATATYPTNRRPTSARVRISPDGTVLVQLAATDLGTGTYTALTQIAAKTLRTSPGRVKVEIGDSDFPQTPGSGGSWGVASYGSAVHDACRDAIGKAAGLGADESLDAFAQRGGLAQPLEGHADSKPGDEKEHYSMHAFGAQFAEVRVDSDTGEVRVSRYVGAFACGRIINEKTARSQFAGGIVMGIGMALSEESVVDERYGHFVNNDLAMYHVPVNRDIPRIDVIMVEERDAHVNPLGTKGIGEIGIVGAASAVVNAVYHATGKRIRELPITPDKVIV